MIDKLQIISLDTIDVESFKLIKEKTSFYGNQDHNRWVFKDPKTNLYYKLWNETYIRKHNVLLGILSNFYDETTCPALYGLIFWEGICRGYIMHECEDYDTINNDFYSIIKEKTNKTQYFAYDFCPQHIKKYNGQLTLIDLEGIYHLDHYELKSEEHQTLQIPGKFVEYEPYKHYIESLLYTPLSKEEFLQLPLQQGRGGKEVILQNYTLKTVKDVIDFFKKPGSIAKVKSTLTPQNWQYFNCMLAEFRHDVGDHHKLGWENMTEKYYSNLTPMSDVEISEFLKNNPVPFFTNLIKHGYHRACSMIGRLINNKSYIPFYVKKKNFYGESPINNINYIDKLDNLGIPRSEYSISNSAILALIGVPERVKNNGDLDIVISSKLRKFLEKTNLKLPPEIHPFKKDSGKFTHFGCKNDDQLISEYSVDILGFRFTEPRFYFNRMHRVLPSSHRSLEENYNIKKQGRDKALSFYKEKKYLIPPFNKISLEGWGFGLIQELKVIK
jgi:hypothetical protein